MRVGEVEPARGEVARKTNDVRRLVQFPVLADERNTLVFRKHFGYSHVALCRPEEAHVEEHVRRSVYEARHEIARAKPVNWL